MKEVATLFSLIFMTIALVKAETGLLVYFCWVTTFMLLLYGWSIYFAVFALLSLVSFHYLDLSSSHYFFATFLPWVCGLSSFIFVSALVFKFAPYMGGGGSNSDIDMGDFGGGD